MKILYLVHQFYPKMYTGTEKFVLQLAQHSQLVGHEVKVITYDATYLPAAKVALPPSYWSGIKQGLKTKLQVMGLDPIQLRRLPAQWLPNRILTKTYVYQGVQVLAFAHQRHLAYVGPQVQDRRLTDFARELLTRERPDVIHAGHMMRVSGFLQVALELGIPYLLTLTDFWALCPNCKLQNERQQLCHGPRGGKECQRACPKLNQKLITQRLVQTHRLLGQAARVITPARFLTAKIRDEFDELAMTVIPYGIDVEQLKPNTRHYPRGAPLVFLFAGALIEAKGIDVLLKAFQALATPNIRLEIYGSGRLAASVRQQAQADSRIHFGGVYAIEQLSEIFQQVDVAIVPSLWHENLPLIMQEAQACGVPTLVSNVGGMTECVTDGVNGFTFRMGDVEDLQQKMQQIIDQPEILNEIKENIRNPKPGQYRVTSLAEETAMYLKEYEQIVAQSLTYQ